MLTRRTFAASALAVTAAGFLAAEGAGAADLDLRMSVESAPGAATQVMLAAFRDALQEESATRSRSSISTAARSATRSCTWRWCAPASST